MFALQITAILFVERLRVLPPCRQNDHIRRVSERQRHIVFIDCLPVFFVFAVKQLRLLFQTTFADFQFVGEQGKLRPTFPALARYDRPSQTADAAVCAETVADCQLRDVLRQNRRIFLHGETVFRQINAQLIRRLLIQNRPSRQRRQYRADADRRQLELVAQKNHAAARRNRTQQVKQQGNIQHRSLIHYQHIQRQRAVAVKRRQHLRRAQFQKAVDRLPFQRGQMIAHRIRHLETVHCPMQRARHMRRRLARRRGKRNTRQARGRVGANQPQKFRHSRRLARTRPARNQHKRLKQGKPRRIPLPCAAFVGKPAGQVLRRAHPIHRLDFRFCQTLDFSRQIMLELPHPPQKQLSALQHQRRRALPDRRRQSRQFLRLALIQPNKRMPVLQSSKQPQHIRRQHRSILRYATLQQMPGRLCGGKVQIIGSILSHLRFPY